jgi:heptosyltransferase-2/heptosyltransferase-3
MIRNGPVLVIRIGALGDLVQFSAVVAAIADHHDQPVDVLTGGGFAAEALTGMPEVGCSYAVRHRRRPVWLAPDLALLSRELAARSYGHVYAFDHVPALEPALVASGAWLHELGATDEVHALDHYAAVLARSGIAVPQPFLPAVTATTGERAAARALVQRHGLDGRPLIVLQPGHSRTLHPLHRLRPTRNLKSWPTAAWRASVAELGERHPEAGFAFAGAASEWSVCEEIRLGLPEAVRSRSANLARELPVRTLAGLFAEALGCISVDTGPAHLAAALGCPTVVLFGPADPLQMAPRGPAPVAVVRSGAACSPCYGTARRDACRENVCMRRIDAATVVEAWESLGVAAYA